MIRCIIQDGEISFVFGPNLKIAVRPKRILWSGPLMKISPAQAEPAQRLVDVATAAKILCMGQSTIRAKINNGTIPSVKIGGAIRLDLQDLESLIAANKTIAVA